MPTSCCVRSCRSTATRDSVKFYHIPQIDGRNAKLKKLSRKRQKLWIRALERQDLIETTLKNARVSSLHFVSGKSSSLCDTESPDWIPTKNMHCQKAGAIISARVARAAKRNNIGNRSEIIYENLGEVPEFENSFVMEPTNENSDPRTKETQTDIPYVDVQELIVRNSALEAKLLLLEKQLAETNKKLQKSKTEFQSFENNDTKSYYLTGISSHKLKSLYEMLEKDLPQSPGIINKFQVLVMTLMRLRLDMPFTYLSYKFTISKPTVSRLFCKCLLVLYSKLRSFILWPSRQQLQSNMPKYFRDKFGDKISVIIDCFEIFIEKPSNILSAAQCWSTYKHCYTVKYLIGISPNGAVIFISNGYGGRASDKFITENSNFLNNLKKGDVVMADRGFLIQKSIADREAEIVMPAFILGKKQLDPLDVERTRRIANLRIHVERVIGFLRNKFLILAKRKFPISALCSEHLLAMCR